VAKTGTSGNMGGVMSHFPDGVTIHTLIHSARGLNGRYSDDNGDLPELAMEAAKLSLPSQSFSGVIK
jgi:hypothetical protein